MQRKVKIYQMKCKGFLEIHEELAFCSKTRDN